MADSAWAEVVQSTEYSDIDKDGEEMLTKWEVVKDLLEATLFHIRDLHLEPVPNLFLSSELGRIRYSLAFGPTLRILHHSSLHLGLVLRT
jgi:hypothetical protein